MKTVILAFSVLGASLLLAGCYEGPGVTVLEPGVYKGAADPLMQKDPEARAETLAQRFNTVQTDR